VEVNYHPDVREDVLEILRYYQTVSHDLSEGFEAELRTLIERAAENPLRFPPAQKGFRRANLKRFPYHFLYEAGPESIRVMIVRHNSRHPQYGLTRA